jgi:F plasmid transfer operon protein TraF
MRSRLVRVAAAVLALGSARPAAAQIYEAVGTRALGMGGAFVAVADDATATWWNPAGLVTGNFLSVVAESGSVTEPRDTPDEGPGRRDSATGFALTVPVLGFSYYRLRISEIAPVPATTDAAGGGRQDQGAAEVALHSIALSQLGVTVGQSLGKYFIIASTLKLVRAGASASAVGAGSDLLDRADDLDVSHDTRGDLDVGAMAAFGAVRLGLGIRNVTTPEFGDGPDRVELERQVRAGAAFLAAPRGALSAVTVAVDGDLTRTRTVTGDVRHIALGLETWFGQRRVGLRSGVSIDTIGPARTTGAAGGSVSLPYGVQVSGAALFGADTSRNGWRLSLGMTF